jgi:hypothetical protein
MACSHSQSCPLFAQFQLNTTLRSWKIMYCDSDTRSRNCQRFKLSESGHTVPVNLLPNGTMLDLGTGPSVSGECGPSAPLPAPAAAPRPAVAVAAAATATPAGATAPVVTSAAPAATVRPATPHAAQPEPASAPARPSAAEIAKSIAPPPIARPRSILERIFGKRA